MFVVSGEAIAPAPFSDLMTILGHICFRLNIMCYIVENRMATDLYAIKSHLIFV